MAGKIHGKPPRVETEIKIGNTTYIVTGHFASQGVTVSDKIRRMLDKETRTKSC